MLTLPKSLAFFGIYDIIMKVNFVFRVYFVISAGAAGVAGFWGAVMRFLDLSRRADVEENIQKR